MQDKLSSNIRALRRERALTQEQLAEALNVSGGVISKWELGLSTPELGLIMELADFFQVSVDVLLGYEGQRKSKELFLDQLKSCKLDKSAPMPVAETEKYLKKYPNDFSVVYYSAQLYALKGLAADSNSFHNRALELYDRALSLISQNVDEKISTTSIAIDMAGIYRSLGQNKRALEILRENNPCGINDGEIGELLTQLGHTQEADKYLSDAMLQGMSRQLNIAAARMNYYEKIGDFNSVVSTAEWIEKIIYCTKENTGHCYLDKALPSVAACKAYGLFRLGLMPECKDELIRARGLALKFDADPNYGAENIKFVTQTEATAYDDFGSTALEGVEQMVSVQKSDAFSKIWENVKDTSAS